MKISKLLLTSIFTLSLFFIGCEDPADLTDLVSPQDSTASAQEVTLANAILGTTMTGIVNQEEEIDSLNEFLDLVDFSDAYNHYSTARTLNPGNADANFGYALTELLMVVQNEDFNAMMTAWETYFRTTQPFAVEGGVPNPPLLGRHGFGLATSVDGMILPITPMLMAPMSMAKINADYVPQFSEFQTIITGVFLPAVNNAITALALVEQVPDYTFTISPAMQGDDSGMEMPSLELDLTEVYLIDGMLYGIQAVCQSVVAYNFDFATHDANGIVAELNLGSDFATLYSDGATNLSASIASMRTGLTKIDDAITFLENETDDQSNDLITYDSPEELEEAREGLAEATSALNGPTQYYFETYRNIYDDDGYWIGDEWIEDSLTVDLTQFFENPITDFKTMIPGYTVTAGIDSSTDWSYGYDNIYYSTDAVVASGFDNTYSTFTFNYSMNGEGEESLNVQFNNSAIEDINIADVPAPVIDTYNYLLSKIDEYANGNYNYVSIYFSWYGYITTGSSLDVNGVYYTNLERNANYTYYPIVTWDADTFDEWKNDWPDATFNGIFPDMTIDELIDFLGANEYDWQKIND